MNTTTAVLLLLAWLVGDTRAMVPPMTAAGVPPRSSVTPFSTAAGDGLGVSLLSRQSSRSSLRSGTRPFDGPHGQNSHTWRTILALDYQILPKTTLILTIPHVYNRSADTGFSETTNALGDIALYGKYAIYEDRPKNAKRQLSALGGLKFPSGSTSIRDGQGDRLAMPQQPGSGTIDVVAGAAALWDLPIGSVYGDAAYKFNTKAAYTFGDSVSVNAGLNVPVPFYEPLSATGEINAEIAGRDRSKEQGPGVLPGGRVRDTGSELIFLTPGVQWRLTKRSAVSFSVQLPVYQNVRGTQLASGPNYNLGVYTRFGSKRRR